MVKVKTHNFSSQPPGYTDSGQNVDNLWTAWNPMFVHFLSRFLISLKVSISQYVMVGHKEDKFWTEELDFDSSMS